MELSEHDEKRLRELADEIEGIHTKIKRLLFRFKGGTGNTLTQSEAEELNKLFAKEEELLKEFLSIPEQGNA